MQHGVIDLDVRVLQFERHDVQHMLTLDGVRDHALDVFEPWRGVSTAGHGGAGIAPAVAIHQTLTGAKDCFAGGVGHAHKRLGALGLAVLIKADRRLNLALGVVD